MYTVSENQTILMMNLSWGMFAAGGIYTVMVVNEFTP